MKFWFCLGTAAELIKVYPIIDEAENRNIEWFIISTGQSGSNFVKQYQDFNLPENRLIKLQDTDKDLTNAKTALGWFCRSLFTTHKKILSLIQTKSVPLPTHNDFWFVHGDTLSTLVASLYGYRFKIPLVHIEAGLRSHNLLNPFPEEICRRIVSRLVSFHMPQDTRAERNLRCEGITQNIFVTNGNTVMDTLNLAVKNNSREVGGTRYALVNIHRFENLSSEMRWRKIVDTIFKASQKITIVFVLMPNTETKIENDAKLKSKLIKANVQLVKRLPYSQFVHLLNGAEFVITDGGSNQEECFYLGKPCLILRDITERFEGLGGCCVLGKFKDAIINDFLADPSKFKSSSVLPQKRATDVVFESLIK